MWPQMNVAVCVMLFLLTCVCEHVTDRFANNVIACLVHLHRHKHKHSLLATIVSMFICSNHTNKCTMKIRLEF